MVKNSHSLTRAITETTKYEHITPISYFNKLVVHRAKNSFKICLIVHKALHKQSSASCSPLIQWQQIRSTNSLILVVSRPSTVLCSRMFSVSDPSLGNSLPSLCNSMTKLSNSLTKTFEFTAKSLKFNAKSLEFNA